MHTHIHGALTHVCLHTSKYHMHIHKRTHDHVQGHSFIHQCQEPRTIVNPRLRYTEGSCVLNASRSQEQHSPIIPALWRLRQEGGEEESTCVCGKDAIGILERRERGSARATNAFRHVYQGYGPGPHWRQIPGPCCDHQSD